MTRRRLVARGPLPLLLLGTFVLNAATSSVFALLADLQRAYHLPDYGLGLVTASAFAASLVAQLTLASLADRGHARALLMWGLGLAVVSAALFAVGTSLLVFALARMTTGLAVGVFVPAARALVASIDPAETAHNLGRLAGVELAGFTAGPVVASLIAGPLGLKAPFVLMAVPAALVLLALARYPLPVDTVGDVSHRASFRMLVDRPVRVATLLAMTEFLPIGVYDALWARYLIDRGASTLFVGISLTLYTLPFVVFAPIGGRLADRFGPVRCAVVALLGSTPVIWIYGVLSRPGLIAATALVDALFQAVAVPAAQAAMSRAAPPGRAAAGQGLAGAAQQGTAAVVAIGAAWLYGAHGAGVVFASAAVAVAVLSVVALIDAARGDAVVLRDAAPA